MLLSNMFSLVTVSIISSAWRLSEDLQPAGNHRIQEGAWSHQQPAGGGRPPGVSPAWRHSIRQRHPGSSGKQPRCAAATKVKKFKCLQWTKFDLLNFLCLLDCVPVG